VNARATGVLHFLDFVLDPANARLRRGAEVIALRPKTLAVLAHLASHAGRLVTKQELLDTVWAETAVGEWVLSGCIRELRRALGDDPKTPRMIETAHRHGYRFVAAVDATSEPAADGERHRERDPAIVGRERDLGVLATRLARARAGERQLVMVAGEAGIGKTTLVDAFCAELAAAGENASSPWIARGQCLQQFGASEPYLPVLEALTRLAGSPAGRPLHAALRRHAPAWLVQMPALVEPAEAAELERRLVGTTRERMLREAAGLVEILDRPLVLVLEDLHWCDYATLDLVAALAQRRDRAALLVIGTYRPADVIVSGHPLKAVIQDLAGRGACHQLWLENLALPDVARYLDGRCPGLANPDALAAVLYARTDGNPLFVRSVVDALVARNALVEESGRWTATVAASAIGVEVPDGLGQMIQRRIDQLRPADRIVLEAASVVGRTPSAAAVAAALEDDVVDVEDRLDGLARQGSLVRAVGEIAWPDGTVAGGYALTHALYQAVLRDGVPPARRRRLHQRVANRLEAAFAGRRDEIAADLALHLEDAGEIARAIPYREITARRAAGRGAAREATALFERTLDLLDTLPPSAERTLATIRTSLALGLTLQLLVGFGHPDVERAYERARRLAEETDDVPQLFQAMAALVSMHLSRAELATARAAADRLEALAERMPFPGVVQVSSVLSGIAKYHTATIAEARVPIERAVALEVGEVTPVPLNIALRAQAYLGLIRFHEGRPDDAVARIERAITDADNDGTPFDQAQIGTVACFVSFFLRDLDGLERNAARAAAVGRDHGFMISVGVAKIAAGRAMAARGRHADGVAAIREGIDDYRAAGQLIALPTELAMLAEAHADAGAIDEALAVIAEARRLVATNGDVRYLAELHRLEGELRARQSDPDAEPCFRRAIAIAAEQGSRWWELRARTSLVEWQRAHTGRDGDPEFAAFVATFTEGAATPDLRAAHRLLRA